MMISPGDKTINAIIKRCARRRWTTVALCALTCGLLVHMQVGSVVQGFADDGRPVRRPQRLVAINVNLSSAQALGPHGLNASALPLASQADRGSDSFVQNPRQAADPKGGPSLNPGVVVQQASLSHRRSSDPFAQDLLRTGDPRRGFDLTVKLARHGVEIVPPASQNNGTSAPRPSQRGGTAAAAGVVEGRLAATRSRPQDRLPAASSQPLQVPRKISAGSPSAATLYPVPPDPAAASRDTPRPKLYPTPTRFYEYTPPPFPQWLESESSAEFRQRGFESPGTEGGSKKTVSYPHSENISAPARLEVAAPITTMRTTVTPLTTLHAIPSHAPLRHAPAKYHSPPPLPLR